MKIRFLLLFAPFFASASFSEPMTQEKLHEVIDAYAIVSIAQDNVVVFEYDGMELVCVSDATADRMRIISEIVDFEKLPLEQVVAAMAANFHTALDARYAIGNGKVYSAYIHPLSPLTEKQIQSAIRQVATAALTFGSSYSSGELVYPGSGEEERNEEASGDV